MEPQPQEQRALEDAAALLRFAAENWGDLQPQSILDIQSAWQARDDKNWTPEIAQKFWSAFNKICTAISPVTVESLRTNELTIQRRSWRWHFGADQYVSLSARTAKHFLWLMLILLAGAVTLGYIVSATGSLRSDILALQKKDADSLTKIMADFANLTMEESAAGAQAGRGSSTGQLSAAAVKSIGALQMEIHNLEADENLARYETNSVSALTYWGSNTYHYTEMHDDPGKLNGLSIIGKRIDTFSQNEDGIRKYLEDSWQMVAIINSALLPVILGAMGACAYMVRLISDQIKTSTFLPTSRIRGIARVALGALAGVVIGYGFTNFGNSTISQAALAFVAGYAIDPVFAIFDKIAQSFK